MGRCVMQPRGFSVARGMSIASVLLFVAASLVVGCSSDQEQPAIPDAAQAEARPKPAAESETAKAYVPEFSPEIEDRIIAVRFFDKAAPDTFQKCLDALKEEHFAVRKEAVAKLEDLGGDRAIATLGNVLTKDANVAVRLRAAEALEFLKEKTALDQLARGLSDADANVRESAADALRYHGTPEHKKVIEAALAKEGDRNVKSVLEAALENLDLPAKAQSEDPAKPDTKGQ